MIATNKLLDNAKEACSIASDMALAARLNKSRQLVSDWRKGVRAIQDDDIAQLADMAREDAGAWLARIHAEQTTGRTARAWESLLARLSAAAVLAVAALTPYHASGTASTAGEQNQVRSIHYAQLRRLFLAALRKICASPRRRAWSCVTC